MSLVSLSQSLETVQREEGDLSSFPLHLSLLFVLVSIDEQQPSILFPSETKCCRYSRPASSKLAAWPSFSSLGRLHKAIALPWGKNAIKRWHKHWVPVVAVPRKEEGWGNEAAAIVTRMHRFRSINWTLHIVEWHWAEKMGNREQGSLLLNEPWQGSIVNLWPGLCKRLVWLLSDLVF